MAWPELSTTVHWGWVEQDTETASVVESRDTEGALQVVPFNWNECPAASVATHRLFDAQDTEVSAVVPSMSVIESCLAFTGVTGVVDDNAVCGLRFWRAVSRSDRPRCVECMGCCCEEPEEQSVVENQDSPGMSSRRI